MHEKLLDFNASNHPPGGSFRLPRSFADDVISSCGGGRATEGRHRGITAAKRIRMQDIESFFLESQRKYHRLKVYPEGKEEEKILGKRE